MRGETNVSELKDASKEMYDSMSVAGLEEYASTDHDGLPDYADDDDQDGLKAETRRAREESSRAGSVPPGFSDYRVISPIGGDGPILVDA